MHEHAGRYLRAPILTISTHSGVSNHPSYELLAQGDLLELHLVYTGLRGASAKQRSGCDGVLHDDDQRKQWVKRCLSREYNEE